MSAPGAEALEIYAFAPGIEPTSIDVSVEKGLLTLSGPVAGRPRKPAKNAPSTPRSASTAPSAASSPLPEDSDPDRVEASYRNGVLKLVVPRLEAAKPRQIQSTAEPHRSQEEPHAMNEVSHPEQPVAQRVAATRAGLLPPVDIVEDAAGITLTADLPGVDQSDLSIGIDGRTLTLEAPLRLGEADSLVFGLRRSARQPLPAQLRAEQRARHDRGRRQPEGRRADPAPAQARAGEAAPDRGQGRPWPAAGHRAGTRLAGGRRGRLRGRPDFRHRPGDGRKRPAA